MIVGLHPDGMSIFSKKNSVKPEMVDGIHVIIENTNLMEPLALPLTPLTINNHGGSQENYLAIEQISMSNSWPNSKISIELLP